MNTTKRMNGKDNVFMRCFCIIISIVMIVTAIPMHVNAATTMKKFIKADSKVFVPSNGETVTISWNFETDHNLNVMVMDGDKVIAYLAKDKKFKGNYEVQELTWDGKDENGQLAEEGTYTVVVEPQEAVYKKYKSITNVTVIEDNTKEISISPNTSGDTFVVYGKGGKNQGVNKVTLTASVSGSSTKTLNATIGDNLWFASLPMTYYKLYDLEAIVKSSSGTRTKHMSAVRHIFRVTDKLVYLSSAYFGDYQKDQQIIDDNHLSGTFTNEGELVGSNILILNPSMNIVQKLKKDSEKKRQHLGVIDELQRTASANPVSLTMGNNFYSNNDLAIEGYEPLTFGRMYNSMSYSFNEFGMNWSNSFTYYLQDMGKNVAIQFEDGHTEFYSKNSDGTYSTAEGLVRNLVKNTDGTYTLTTNDTEHFDFGADGSLLRIRDLNGNTTTLTYTKGMLSQVKNLSGYFNLTYNTDGTIKSIKDSGNRSVNYRYENGLITGFTDVNGYETTYVYDTLNRLTKVISPEKVTILDISYDKKDRVITKNVQGSIYTYSYDDTNRRILCTEPNGNKITFQYSEDYRIESEEYSDGTIKYYYKDGSNSTKQTKTSAIGKNGTYATISNVDIDGTKATNLDKASVTAKNSGTKTNVSKKEQKKDETDGISLLSLDSNIPKLELKTHNMNTATGSAINNTLYPQFRIINTSNGTVNLSDITIRYYYTVDGEKPQNFFCDWSQAGAQNVTGKFYKMSTPIGTADYFLEVGFTAAAGTLEPGKSVETHVRIGKSDWSVFTPGNDYSQNMASDFTYFDQVDMFYKGNLVWGKGSLGSGEVSNPNPGGDSGSGKQDPGDNGGSWENPEEEEKEQVIPKGKNKLKLQMYNTGNSGDTTNTIHPMMRLINNGGNMVKLSDITIRYYYTVDDDTPQNFWCDWSSAGQQNITGTFHTMEKKGQDADTYLEVGFKEGSGYIDIGADLDIHVRIAKNDWSNYDITNDYSINPKEYFEDWKKVDVFINGVKVWGEGVLPGAEEELTEEHIDYADTTYTPVKAEMFNTKREDFSNFIAPRFRIYNTGTEAIKLSDLRIAYFYTSDGPETQIFEADWAAIGSRFQYSLNKSDVICEFTEVGDDNLATNCVADIGFTRSDLTLEPGDYLELHTRIHRQNWTNYVQTNDYSLNPDSTDYEEWNKIAVFVKDKWAFGSLPLTYASVIDPNPEGNLPIDTRGSYGSDTDKSGNATYYSYDQNGNITERVDALGNKTSYTYNDYNLITSLTDALGNKTLYDYDNKGNLTVITDALGNVTKLTYNSIGCITKIEMPNGGIEVRDYDSKGNLTSITDANGTTVTFTYDGLNRIKTYTDGNGNTKTYDYRLDGSISKITDALGFTIKADYNKDGQITKETNQNGAVTQYSYSKVDGRLSSMTNALSGVERYKYDVMGNLVEITLPDGSKTSYDYDLFGRKISVTDGEGAKTSYTYDVSGNVSEEKDALGNITKYSYDKGNRLIKLTDAEHQVTQYEYDALGRVLKVTDAAGAVTSYEYDSIGNRIKTMDALGNTTKQEYNKLGLLAADIDADGNKTSYDYDAVGRLIQIKDPAGNSVQYTYDKNDNKIEEKNALGDSTYYSYDKLDRLTSVKDALGNTISYTYDGVGNQTAITDALGNTTKFAYNDLNYLTEESDALGQKTSYDYNLVGQKIKQTDPLMNVTTYTYDKAGKIISQKDALGNEISNTYNALGRLVSETDAKGNKTTYEYDAIGRKIKETDALGGVTKWSYDNNGNINQITNSLGNSSSYTYDSLNRVTEYKDARGNKTTYDYDTRGNRILDTDAKGNKTSYQYNSLNQLMQVTNALGQKTKYEYDAQGNLIKETNALGYSISYKYDKNGNLIQTTDELGNVTKTSYTKSGFVESITDEEGNKTVYQYNKVGQQIAVTDQRGNVTKWSYDKNGNLKEIKNAKGAVTSYSYDTLNRLTQIKEEEGIMTSYQYDAFGNITEEKDGKGNVTKKEYDALGNLTKVTDALGHTTSYTYDSLGNLKQQTRHGATTSKNQVTTYTYNENGQVSTIKDPLGTTLQYDYDENGRLLKETAQDGSSTAYTYDAVGNTINISYSTGKTVKYTYDAAGRLLTMKDWNGTTTYQYDAKGRKTKVTDANNQSLGYTWTKNDQKKTMTYPDGSRVSYDYDKAGNLVKVTDTKNGTTTYSYDATNALVGKVLPNGTESEYTYDKADQLIERKEKGKFSTGQSSNNSSNPITTKTYTYAYDFSGNRTKETAVINGTTEITAYTYDALNQLTKVSDSSGSRTYTYDEFSNRATKGETGESTIVYTYNKKNQLIQTTQGTDITNYSYDERGNLLGKKRNGITEERYTFDATNMLVQVNNDKTHIKTQYTYDGAGNRIQKEITEGNSNISYIDYVVDTESEFQDIVFAKKTQNNNGSSIHSYSAFTYGNGLISVETDGKISYYEMDEKNSISEIFDANGNLQAELQYDEFGTIKNPADVATGGNIFAYTGYVYEESNGLSYAKARYFDPSTGRFISEDTYPGYLEKPISRNLYIYVQNNPVIHVDPTGHETVVVNKNGVRYLKEKLHGKLYSKGFAPKDETNEIKAYKEKLRYLAYYHGYINSTYDTGMFQAVAKFQNDYKIYVSHKGIMEQRTMAAIDAAYRLKLSLNSIGQVISSKSMQRAVLEIIKGTPSGNTYEIVNRGKLKQGNIYQVYDPQGYEKILTYSVLEVASYIPAVEYAAAAGRIFADNYFGNDATASTMELLNNATIDIAIVVVTGTVGKAVKIVKNVKKVDKAADAAKQVKKTETAARTKGGSFKYNLQFFASSKGGSQASNLNSITDLMKQGTKTADGKNIITHLDDNTKVIFRMDVGDNAHEMANYGYSDSINHINIEIQSKSASGKWGTKWNYHIILDEAGGVLDTFTTGVWKNR